MHRRRETVAHLVENGQAKGLCGRQVMRFKVEFCVYGKDILLNDEGDVIYYINDYKYLCERCANIFKWRPTLKQKPKSIPKPKPKKQLPESDLFSNI